MQIAETPRREWRAVDSSLRAGRLCSPAISRAPCRSADLDIRVVAMDASLIKFLGKSYSIALSNTDTGRENVLHFYYSARPIVEGFIRELDSGNFMAILFEENACLQAPRRAEIPLSREWVAKIGDVFAHIFVVPRQYFDRTASIGASRRPRIWYLAA